MKRSLTYGLALFVLAVSAWGAGQIRTQDLRDGAVTTAKLTDGAVTNQKLGSDLDAGKIAAGILSDARLSSNVPKLDAANAFSGTVQIGASGTPLVRVVSQTAVLDFLSTPADSCSDLDMTGFTGLSTGDSVSVGVPASSVPAGGGDYFVFVKNATTATIRFCNPTAAALDPASGTFRATVAQF